MGFNIGDIVRAKTTPHIASQQWAGQVALQKTTEITLWLKRKRILQRRPKLFRASSAKEGGNKNGCERNHY